MVEVFYDIGVEHPGPRRVLFWEGKDRWVATVHVRHQGVYRDIIELSFRGQSREDALQSAKTWCDDAERRRVEKREAVVKYLPLRGDS